MRVITAPNEIEEKIDWVKGLVNSTNERVETYNSEMKKLIAEEKAQIERQGNIIREMREKLKKKHG